MADERMDTSTAFENQGRLIIGPSTELAFAALYRGPEEKRANVSWIVYLPAIFFTARFVFLHIRCNIGRRLAHGNSSNRSLETAHHLQP